MIPRIARGGRSFKGAYAYFGHDKQQATKHRVEWTHTENMLTDNPDKAWKVMAYTVYEQARLKEASGQKATGRKLQKPVFSYSLAWHPEQNPDRKHMLETAKKSVAVLGFTEHEMLIVAHRDEPQRHVHVIVNRVHPITGIAADLTNSKQKLSDFAHAYELEDGKVYCKQREENVQKRKEGKETRYADLDIVKAWNDAADGKAFIQALKNKGFHLAQGRKRIVLVDKFGKISNPARQLPGVKAKDLKAKLGDLNLRALFDAASLRGQIQNKDAQEIRRATKGSRRETFAAEVRSCGTGEIADCETVIRASTSGERTAAGVADSRSAKPFARSSHAGTGETFRPLSNAPRKGTGAFE